MTASETYNPFLPGFIDRLKRQGFSVGVDGHIWAEAALHRLGPSVGPGDLKYLLCPLFAVDAASQARFHREFDRHFAFLGSERSEAPAAAETNRETEKANRPPLSARRWPYWVVGILLLMACAWMLVFWGGERTPTAGGGDPGAGAGAGHSTHEEPGETVTIPSSETPIQQPLGPGPGPGTPVKPGETVTITLTETPVQQPSEPDPPPWWQLHGNQVRTFLLIVPWIVWLMAEWHHHRRKRLALARGRTRKPPYTYALRLKPVDPPFFRDRRFWAAANALRTRLAGDVFQPDAPATIRATVEAGGYPALRYKAMTRPPEYLFLINLAGPRDCRPRFMEALARGLENEGIFVARLYFKDDPQVVFPEPGGRRVRLADIRSKFGQCRLIVAGTGDGLLDPFTGDLEDWTEMFRFWQDRAVLTPRPARRWGMREAALAREFVVLPASVEGLAALPECFVSPDKRDVRAWALADRRRAPRPPDPPLDVSGLRHHLGEIAFQWLCVCAVYPELHWNLALHLTAFLDRPVAEEDVVRLIRLPWFRDGALPEALQGELLACLAPERLTAVREAILAVLEDNPPPPESGAWDVYQLNIAIHGRLLSGSQKRALRAAATGLTEERVRQDRTLMRILESGAGPSLAMRLPKWVQKMFFRGGLPFFGLKTGVRVALALVAFLLVWRFVPATEPYVRPSTAVTETLETRETVGMTLAYIPPGEFMMGSFYDEPGRFGNEQLHKVKLTEGFYIQNTEVTQKQWEALMNYNPSVFKDCGPECPVESISWEDVQSFIKKLNEREGDRIFKLPTEAQWEYVARAGSETAFASGGIVEKGCGFDPNLDDIGWYCGNSKKTTHQGGEKRANALGIYDMHGNVWEWCADWYGDYPKHPVTDPTGPEKGEFRVFRGGSWISEGRYCRSACRLAYTPSYRVNYLGFRVLAIRKPRIGGLNNQ